MKITFITGHLVKEKNPLLYELAVDLAKQGADVTVVSGFPSRRIKEETRKYYLNMSDEYLLPNLRVLRVGSKKGEGKSLFVRMLKYIALTINIYRKAKEIDTDVYYIYSTPPFLGVIGAFLAKKAPTLYNAQDIFPDTLIALKKLNENNILVKVLRKMEHFIYKNNTHILTISRDIKNTIIGHGCMSDKISVIHNWVDTNNISPVSRKDNLLFDKFKLDKKYFYISYAGNIGLLQNLDIIIDAAEIIKEINNDIKFVIIGEGAWKETLLKLCQEKQLDNVLIFPIQPQELVSKVYSLGDVEIVSIGKGVTKTALPSKTWNIMSVGRPIIAMVDNDSEIASIIECNKLGVVVRKNTPKSFVDAVLYCYDNKEKLSEWGSNSRKYVIEHNHRQYATKKYFDVLSSLVKK